MIYLVRLLFLFEFLCARAIKAISVMPRKEHHAENYIFIMPKPLWSASAR